MSSGGSLGILLIGEGWQVPNLTLKTNHKQFNLMGLSVCFELNTRYKTALLFLFFVLHNLKKLLAASLCFAACFTRFDLSL